MGDQPRSEAYAALFRNKGKKPAKLDVKDANIRIEAKNDGNCEKGTAKAEALVADGLVKGGITGGTVNVVAENSGEDLKMIQLIAYLSNVLENLPKENLQKLARELRDEFGVFAEDELKYIGVAELEKGLKTIKAVQKTKLVEHVKKLQNA